ncbi:hypothetical protein RIF29_28917 [Crotalaria pallida]|uniref:Uncharacterized protein n=1 Tax=Crotalaria pallida TaxID=3830 RepID=A0AAN9HWZ2_CROPI
MNNGISDHCPALIKGTYQNCPKSGSFMFLNMFTQAFDFLNIVRDVWQVDIPGYAMYRVGAKLKMLKEPLKMFNSRDFSDIDLKEKQMRLALDDVQTRLRSNPQDDKMAGRNNANIAEALTRMATVLENL